MGYPQPPPGTLHPGKAREVAEWSCYYGRWFEIWPEEIKYRAGRCLPAQQVLAVERDNWGVSWMIPTPLGQNKSFGLIRWDDACHVGYVVQAQLIAGPMRDMLALGAVCRATRGGVEGSNLVWKRLGSYVPGRGITKEAIVRDLTWTCAPRGIRSVALGHVRWAARLHRAQVRSERG